MKHLFNGEYSIDHFFTKHSNALKARIYSIDEGTFLLLNDAFKIDTSNEVRLDRIIVDWNSLDKEQALGTDKWNADINKGHVPGTTVSVVYVKYFVNHNGRNFNNILSYRSNQYIDDNTVMWESSFDGDLIRFNIYGYGTPQSLENKENKDKIIHGRERVIEIIKHNVEILNRLIDSYNSSLPSLVEALVQSRKDEIKKHKTLMQGL